MLPRNQFNRTVYSENIEDFFYFATKSGLYLGSQYDLPKKISDRNEILSLAMWKKRLYAGTTKGEIIDVKNNSVLHCRKGPVNCFVSGKVLHDISSYIGENMIHETLKPCSERQEFWLSDNPNVCWHRQGFVVPCKKGIADLRGELVKYTQRPVMQFVHTIDGLWTVQDNVLMNSFDEPVTELPPDADSIICFDGSAYYLRDAGLEKMVLENRERTRLFPDHIITCFAPVKYRVRRPITA